MNDKHLHISNLEKKEEQLFSHGKIVWEKSQEDVWADLESKISSKPAGKSVLLFPKLAKITAAAMITLLVGLGALTFLYTKTVECEPGNHLFVELPDHSTVELNAGSTLKYKPLKWRFERKLRFEGEGFFDVKKGNSFLVESAAGNTSVLGTSFNIYARNDQYRVTCLTGKVEVRSNLNETVLLSPDYHVEIKNGKIVMNKKHKTEEVVSWKNNQFFFSGRPLKEVFDEIERQYAITIQLHPSLYERSFASNFTKKHNVEEVLDFICKTMQIKFVKQSETVFLVVEKS